MPLDFETVYKLTYRGNPEIVMAPVALPHAKGWWLRRTSPDHPELTLEGETFEGADGKVVIVTKEGPAILEPLTIELWQEMSPSDSSHLTFETDGDLQEFYWSDFMADAEDEGMGDPESIRKGLVAKHIGAVQEMREGREARPGEVHQWEDGLHVKQRDGSWKRVLETGGEGADVVADTLNKMSRMIAAGELAEGMDLHDHVRVAQETEAKHRKGAAAFGAAVEEAVGSGAIKMGGRVKTVGSLLGKVVEKPHWVKKADEVQDGTGYRVVHETLAEVYDTVEKLKKRFKLGEEEPERDYIKNPQGSYRSFHLIVKDDDGLEKEIQIRTRRQDELAEWTHDVFKPRSREQAAKVRECKDDIDKIQTKIADWAHAKDEGKDPGPHPLCPEHVSSSIGCKTVE